MTTKTTASKTKAKTASPKIEGQKTVIAKISTSSSTNKRKLDSSTPILKGKADTSKDPVKKIGSSTSIKTDDKNKVTKVSLLHIFRKFV